MIDSIHHNDDNVFLQLLLFLENWTNFNICLNKGQHVQDSSHLSFAVFANTVWPGRMEHLCISDYTWEYRTMKSYYCCSPSFIIEGPLIVAFIEIWREYVKDATTNWMGNPDSFTFDYFLSKNKKYLDLISTIY